MRFNRFLESALNDIISGFERSGDKADLFLNGYFRSNRTGKRDRQWISDRFYFYLRHKLLVEKVTEKPEKRAENISMIFDNEPDYELNELLNTLKNSGDYKKLFDRSFSKFLVDKIVELYGLDVFEWFNKKSKIVIRANLIKTTREKLIELLLNEGYVSEKTAISPAGLIVTSTSSGLKNSNCYASGLFEFQDESSQLSSLLLNRNTETLLDACAGGGGKSLALGCFFKKIKITASDRRCFVFKEILSRADRAGLKIKTVEPNLLKDSVFDAVFVDAPCSGSGVLRRNPADRWNIDSGTVKKNKDIQNSLIQKFSENVKPGGEIIYVTCSFLPEENEQVVEQFINKNKDFSFVSVSARLLENIKEKEDISEIIKGDFFRTGPFFERDLMFGAILRKNK